MFTNIRHGNAWGVMGSAQQRPTLGPHQKTEKEVRFIHAQRRLDWIGLDTWLIYTSENSCMCHVCFIWLYTTQLMPVWCNAATIVLGFKQVLEICMGVWTCSQANISYNFCGFPSVSWNSSVCHMACLRHGCNFNQARRTVLVYLQFFFFTYCTSISWNISPGKTYFSSRHSNSIDREFCG